MFKKPLLLLALAIAPLALSQNASAQCCSSPAGYAAYSMPNVVYPAAVAPVVYATPAVAYGAYYPPVRYGVAYRGYSYRPRYGYSYGYGVPYGYRSYYRPYGGVSISVGF